MRAYGIIQLAAFNYVAYGLTKVDGIASKLYEQSDRAWKLPRDYSTEALDLQITKA